MELWPAGGLALMGFREVQAMSPECDRVLLQGSAVNQRYRE